MATTIVAATTAAIAGTDLAVVSTDTSPIASTILANFATAGTLHTIAGDIFAYAGEAMISIVGESICRFHVPTATHIALASYLVHLLADRSPQGYFVPIVGMPGRSQSQEADS